MQSQILQDPDALLRQADLIGKRDRATGRRAGGLIPVSGTTLWRWVGSGDFPKPLKLGANTSAWRAADVAAWLSSRG